MLETDLKYGNSKRPRQATKGVLAIFGEAGGTVVWLRAGRVVDRTSLCVIMGPNVLAERLMKIGVMRC